MNLEELKETIQTVTAPAFRNNLLAKGQARSMIWRDGILPHGAPRFSHKLSYELESYAFALLSITLRVREHDGDGFSLRRGFEQSGIALEAIFTNGDSNDLRRGFRRILAASSFHLGGFSARAFSLLHSSLNESNLSVIERALALLILRSFDSLEQEILDWCIGENATDETIKLLFEQVDNVSNDDVGDDTSSLEAVNIALNQNFMRGLGAFLFALETGESHGVVLSKEVLKHGLDICRYLNLVPQWWCYRVTIHLVDDLWSSTFHEVLPSNLPEGNATNWQEIRDLFIASLTRRKRSEIELWPSQIEAATRSTDIHDDLVVSLPTSAGKTRIAELCILRTLAEGERVVFVTPLRALSAQTEASLRETFGPLGKKVSALYGSIGIGRFDEDVFSQSHIVVATPEKLDFAIRNTPSLIDDVGLIVLDEGHMIGMGEREVRYEAQVQRLLRRSDADKRRIVCLSAVLPSDEQLEDFVDWLRKDKDGAPIISDWRPTRIRYGEVVWLGKRARLNLTVDEERPFVSSFISAKIPPKGRRKQPFPRDNKELVLATTWRLIEDGQSVLIYCPERRSVEPLAKAVVDLHNRGLLSSIMEGDGSELSTALSIGQEWLGREHPVLECLRLGVAVHHGALPTPFRKEMERLLRKGTLKVTVSSPTLAQGLNLTATAIIFYSIRRARQIIPTAEFRNVIGRAGRAFIDVQGLVLFPIFKNQIYRRSQWRYLINKESRADMESGLLRLVMSLLERLRKSLGNPPLESLLEYIVNNAYAWSFPEIADESEDDCSKALKEWNHSLERLDTAILSIAGDENVTTDEIATTLDSALEASLWARSLQRRPDNVQNLMDNALKARAGYIWSKTSFIQRKGYFLAGVGLNAGQQLDAIAEYSNQLLLEANVAIIDGDNEQAIAAITLLAEALFTIEPFIPVPLPDNWRQVLSVWLEGSPISDVADDTITETLRFVEDGLIYRLPWGLEALRVRAQANQDEIAGMPIDELDLGLAVQAVETGTLNRSVANLMKAGFASRIAASKAVNETDGNFHNTHEFSNWLHSGAVVEFSKRDNWPTEDSSGLWKAFRREYSSSEQAVWSVKTATKAAQWEQNTDPKPGNAVRVYNTDMGTLLLSATYELLGKLTSPITKNWDGILKAQIGDPANNIVLTYYGPDDLDL